MALWEGTPDFIAMLTAGMQPNAEGSAWATSPEALITPADPAAILAASGYDVGWCAGDH